MEALGIVAFVLSIIALLAPFVGVFISGPAGILAVFGCLKRNKYALSAIIINILNLTFFSPLVFLYVLNESDGVLGDIGGFRYVYWVIFAIQVLGILIYCKSSKFKADSGL